MCCRRAQPWYSRRSHRARGDMRLDSCRAPGKRRRGENNNIKKIKNKFNQSFCFTAHQNPRNVVASGAQQIVRRSRLGAAQHKRFVVRHARVPARRRNALVRSTFERCRVKSAATTLECTGPAARRNGASDRSATGQKPNKLARRPFGVRFENACMWRFESSLSRARELHFE